MNGFSPSPPRHRGDRGQAGGGGCGWLWGGEGGVDSFNDVYESNDVHITKYAHQEDVGRFCLCLQNWAESSSPRT